MAKNIYNLMIDLIASNPERFADAFEVTNFKMSGDVIGNAGTDIGVIQAINNDGNMYRTIVETFGLVIKNRDAAEFGHLLYQHGIKEFELNGKQYENFTDPFGMIKTALVGGSSYNGNTINFDLSFAGSIWGDTNNRLFGDALGYADGQLNGEGGKVQIMLTDMNLADGMDGLLKARADIINRYGDPEKYIITEKTGYANGVSFADGFIIEKIKGSGGGGNPETSEDPNTSENNNDPTQADPSAPTDPNSPTDPNTPTVPNAPTVPDSPSDPNNSSSPSNPNDPGSPSDPGQPTPPGSGGSGSSKPWNPIDPTDPRNWPYDPNNPNSPYNDPNSPWYVPPSNSPTVYDPLILDLNGNQKIDTVGLNKGVSFNHQNDATKNATGWVADGDGLVALDRNGNNTIDSGNELFGENTTLANGQKAKGAYDALAEIDSTKMKPNLNKLTC